MYQHHLHPGTNPELPMLVFIHGYCQTGEETWGETIAELRSRGVDNTCVVLERKLDERCGRMSLGAQLQECHEFVKMLVDYGTLGRHVIWIGHSLGGRMAQDMTTHFPDITTGVIAIGTLPSTGYEVLIRPTFWWNGGIVSLPAVIWSVLTGISVRYPKQMVRGLFAGPNCSDERLDEYRQQLQPDSGWLFVQFLFWYFLADGIKRKLKGLGPERSFIIALGQDKIISYPSLRRLADSTDSRLLWVHAAHCWWLDNQASTVAAEIVRALNKMQ